MEGISGLVRWMDVASAGIDFERNRRLMTLDVNAAIQGAFEAGASDVVVEENHGVEDLCVLLTDEIDPRCSLVRGGGRPGPTTMSCLDESVDIVFLVGHHAAAGTWPGIMAHTVSGGRFSEVRLGGRRVGEPDLFAIRAGEVGAAVALVTGDQMVIEEVRKRVPEVEAVQVKRALGRQSGEVIPPARARGEIRDAAERAKLDLTDREESVIDLPFLTQLADGTRPSFRQVLTRSKLEELARPIIERTLEFCGGCLEEAGLIASDLDEVILVGGMTRMPLVKQKVEHIFARTPMQGVNPDEVVAQGAAIQGSVLSGETEDVLLLDVSPLSLGVETQGGIATRIIERNTTIPTSKSQIFSTTEDSQSVVRIHVVQGEREMAKDNKTLGRFELVGVPAAPRGVPQIEVSFEIDADGVVRVSAVDLGTGKSQEIEVTASGGLNERDIDRLVKEAEDSQEDDRTRRDFVDLSNKADGLIYSTERTLEEFAENVPEEDRGPLGDAIENALSAIDGDELSALRSSVDELSSLTYKMTENLYAALGEDDSEESD